MNEIVAEIDKGEVIVEVKVSFDYFFIYVPLKKEVLKGYIQIQGDDAE